MFDCSAALTPSGNGVIITLNVTAGSGKNAFPAGFNEWRGSIRCHVTAPAVGGRANKAVVNLVAEVFGISKTAVSIVAGATSSTKKVHIDGMDREDALRMIRVFM